MRERAQHAGGAGGRRGRGSPCSKRRQLSGAGQTLFCSIRSIHWRLRPPMLMQSDQSRSKSLQVWGWAAAATAGRHR